ncbi:hypothetical protein [Nonomuraea sp. JJY05]|jgi:hypothetical protein|uniref:hypothetical protein n=1 Tax=Nonomuraea sp. JJY05 TaxID=3350255 RepID=UPI00373F32CD
MNVRGKREIASQKTGLANDSSLKPGQPAYSGAEVGGVERQDAHGQLGLGVPGGGQPLQPRPGHQTHGRPGEHRTRKKLRGVGRDQALAVAADLGPRPVPGLADQVVRAVAGRTVRESELQRREDPFGVQGTQIQIAIRTSDRWTHHVAASSSF